MAAAQRRLTEEMGIVCPLVHSFVFTYSAHVGNGLLENEFDHVFIGHFGGTPHPDPQEAETWRTITLQALQLEMASGPEHFTPWLHACIARVAQVDRPSTTAFGLPGRSSPVRKRNTQPSTDY
jgi:isopentenyl-diphosphate delta-isomerase